MKNIILLTLVLIPAMAYAQTFSKWVGKDGKVHYGDTPPSDLNIHATPVHINPGPAEKQQTYSDYYRKRADSYDDYLQRRSEQQMKMDEKRYESNQRRIEENQRRYEEEQRRRREKEYDDYLRQKAADEQRHKIEVRRSHSTGVR